MDDFLTDEVQNWLISHEGADASKLALKPNPFPNLNYPELLAQLSAREKARLKLPTWFSHRNIVYPSKISVEQTSSEATADFKASLVSGDSIIDCTGGFGVDCHYFAKRFKAVFHCETDAALSQIVGHNAMVLSDENIVTINADSSEYLQKTNDSFDWIYIDPSRRNDRKGKVFLLADCLPNVPENLDLYFSKADNILIKVSPMLDISQAISELRSVKKIIVVALQNEVKELLLLLEKGFSGRAGIFTVNLESPADTLFEWEETETATLSHPLQYLYEPDAAIRKAGVFDAVAKKFGLKKIATSTHLFTSEKLIADFPGRIFTIETVLPYSKSEMKQHLSSTKANVSIRNFPETVEEIRKRWKISDGGNRYAFFISDSENRKIVLLCAKI